MKLFDNFAENALILVLGFVAGVAVMQASAVEAPSTPPTAICQPTN